MLRKGGRLESRKKKLKLGKEKRNHDVIFQIGTRNYFRSEINHGSPGYVNFASVIFGKLI